jgi:hypothetical protein
MSDPGKDKDRSETISQLRDMVAAREERDRQWREREYPPAAYGAVKEIEERVKGPRGYSIEAWHRGIEAAVREEARPSDPRTAKEITDAVAPSLSDMVKTIETSPLRTLARGTSALGALSQSDLHRWTSWLRGGAVTSAAERFDASNAALRSSSSSDYVTAPRLPAGLKQRAAEVARRQGEAATRASEREQQRVEREERMVASLEAGQAVTEALAKDQAMSRAALLELAASDAAGQRRARVLMWATICAAVVTFLALLVAVLALLFPASPTLKVVTIKQPVTVQGR